MGAAALLGMLAGTRNGSTAARSSCRHPDRPRGDVAASRLGRLADRMTPATPLRSSSCAAEVPPGVPGAEAYLREQGRAPSPGPGVAGLVRALATSRPVADRVALASVPAPSAW